MRTYMRIIPLTLMIAAFMSGIVGAEQTIQTIRLSTINWEPYAGESLPDHGFFSELVTEAFSRVGYRVEFQYRPWARALDEAKNGDVHGVMDAYWKEDRVEFLEYPDDVWKVKEEFIALRDTSITYTGSLADLKGSIIGVERGGAQAEELRAADLQTAAVADQVQNVQKLLAGRIDAILIPRAIFFYHLERLKPQFDRTLVKILKPPYKVYSLYVAFSKQKPNYAQLTADFNRGLKRIKTDGTYERVLKKHHIMSKE